MVLVVCLLSLLRESTAEYMHLMRSFTGKVGAGNYTYYKLTHEGYIRLELKSLQGDADIYISDQVLSPQYDNYELCSVTCGEDQVDIEPNVKRPIGIGIYGHPFHEVSHFQLTLYLATGTPEPSEHSYQYHSQAQQGPHNPPKLSPPKEDEESILWSIFVGVLKIIFDILV